MISMDNTKLLKSTFFFLALTLTVTVTLTTASLYSEKVLLSDVKALTLHQGQMTKSRRSPPVPQLKCLGGSAQYKFTPKVVQCINRGSDGYDIQWECKTDMDNSYRFGQVEVTCEGYDYPNDPYVLKGSCGLEYTIELTEEGMQRERQKGGGSYYTSYQHKESSDALSGLLVFVGVLIVMYVIYKACLAPSVNQPPPYGFRSEYMPNQGSPPQYDSFGTQSSAYPNTGFMGGGNGGGFWTGAATGGLFGYLFGRGNNYGRQYGRNCYDSRYPGDSGGSFFSSSSPSSGSSSGTRTASGFGGTSRR